LFPSRTLRRMMRDPSFSSVDLMEQMAAEEAEQLEAAKRVAEAVGPGTPSSNGLLQKAAHALRRACLGACQIT
jgi:hypothetical protein